MTVPRPNPDVLSHNPDDVEMHQAVGFGTHSTVDGNARLIARPA
jgi:hypothetical protein